MFGKRVPLFTLFGFEVKVDASWIFIAVLIVWTLATGFFPAHYRSLAPQSYWLMGVVGALGLFLSIIFHEFCHSLVARRYGLPMKGITLFIFGGVAEMGDEPSEPKVEFLMSAAGPLSSFLLSGVFYTVSLLGAGAEWPVEARGILSYLAGINALLAVFNLMPAFPLDGGRILRSILWLIKKDLRWATRIASLIGAGFGILLVVMSLLAIIAGDLIGGIWLFLIGMFLRWAALMSYQQLLLRRSLEGEPVRRFMIKAVIAVPPDLSVRAFVDDFVYRFHFKMFPVVKGSSLVGCVTAGDAKNIPREKWDETTIGEIASPVCANNAISPETDTVRALAVMNSKGLSRLLVVDGTRLAGIITLKDLLNFFALKLELEK